MHFKLFQWELIVLETVFSSYKNVFFEQYKNILLFPYGYDNLKYNISVNYEVNGLLVEKNSGKWFNPGNCLITVI